jgi:hypothetical protein
MTVAGGIFRAATTICKASLKVFDAPDPDASNVAV